MEHLFQNFWNIIFRKFVTRISDPFGVPLGISWVSVGCFHWMESARGLQLKRVMQNIAGVEIESKEFLRCFEMHVHGMLSTWLPWFAHTCATFSFNQKWNLTQLWLAHSLFALFVPVSCILFEVWFVYWVVCTFFHLWFRFFDTHL